MNKRPSLWILSFGIAIVGILVTLMCELSPEVGAVITIAAVITGLVLYFYIDTKRSQAHDCDIYNKSDGILITKRNSYVSSRFTIKPERELSLGYNPASISYTSVSIGNVSTGSIDFHEESTTVNSRNTGKFYLAFGDEFERVSVIMLTDELAQQAKKNPTVSRFLRENKLILIHKNNRLKSSEISVISDLSKTGLKGATAATNMFLRGTSSLSTLSYKECLDIKRWLAGKC